MRGTGALSAPAVQPNQAWLEWRARDARVSGQSATRAALRATSLFLLQRGPSRERCVQRQASKAAFADRSENLFQHPSHNPHPNPRCRSTFETTSLAFGREEARHPPCRVSMGSTSIHQRWRRSAHVQLLVRRARCSTPCRANAHRYVLRADPVGHPWARWNPATGFHLEGSRRKYRHSRKVHGITTSAIASRVLTRAKKTTRACARQSLNLQRTRRRSRDRACQ